MASGSPGETGYLLLLAIVVIILVRRFYRLVQGTVVSTGRLVGFAAFYLVLFAFVLLSGYAGVPYYALIADGAIVVVATLIAAPYVERIVRFELRADGQWYYRLGLLIPGLYLVLFGVRLAIDVLLIGENPFAPPTNISLSPLQLILLIVVDALFAFSTGLLVGRSVGVYRAFQRQPRTPPAAAEVAAKPLS
jgi:hypothetical protein